MTQPDKKWFADKLKDRSANFRQLGDALGLDRGTIAKIMSGPRTEQNQGGRSATSQEVSGMAQFFNVTAAEIGQRLGLHVGRVASTKVVGSHGADGSITPNRHVSEVPAFLELSSTAVAIVDDTAGSFWLGTVWYYEPRPTVAKDVVGRVCVCMTDDGTEWLGMLLDRDDSRLYDVHLIAQTADSAVRTMLEGVVVEKASPVIGSRWLPPQTREVKARPKPKPLKL